MQFPDYLLHGQIQEIQFKLENNSINPINDLMITFTHPFMFGKSQEKLGDLDIDAEKIFKTWMRGEYIGFHTLKILVSYTSQGVLRLGRIQTTFEVKSSLKIQTRYETSLKDPNENVLQLNIQPTFDSKLILKQISSLTNHSLRIIKSLENEIFYFGVTSGDSNLNIIFDQD